MTLQVNWRGVYPAVTTQLNDDYSINYEMTQQMVDSIIKAGVHGIISMGTVGENMSLSQAEKRKVLTAVKEVVNGRVPLLSGVADTTTAFASDYVKDAWEIGADGFMVLPGMVYRAMPNETIYHFQTIARNNPESPMMIYNNPVTYGVDIDIQMTSILAEEPNMVAIKEASEDTRRLTELRNAFDDRFIIFSGVDDIALESIMLGCTGWISGLTNAFPKESVAIFELAQQKRWDEALEIYRWFLPLLRLDTRPTLVQCIKLCEQLSGEGSEVCRPPRCKLVGAERKHVIDVYEQAIATRPDLSKYNLD